MLQLKYPSSKQEKYDSVGNLKPAVTKAEGDAVIYGDVKQAYETTIVNETIANGFSVTMEAKEDEKWQLVPEIKVSELVRTMLNQREVRVASVWDGVTSTVGADGVNQASHVHPLMNSASTNDNLVDVQFNIDTYDLANRKFNHWLNHSGEKFYTAPTSMLLHRDRQTQALAMLQSSQRPFENTNTKNTIPQLKLVFSTYIDQLPVHLIDESIDSVIFQQRKKLTDDFEYDNKDTFNFYYNVHERYKAGLINSGFGFVTIAGINTAVLVILEAGSVGVAGNGTITGLTAGTKYQITFGGKTYPIIANGTVGTEGASAVALTGTAITGLSNGNFYLVQEVA